MRLVIVFPPHIDFDQMQQRPQRLMEQFARAGHDVLYMNSSVRNLPPQEVEPNLWIIWNHADIFKEIHLRRESGMKSVLFSMWTNNWHYHDDFRPDLTIYDYIDDFKEWEHNLPKMVQRADFVTCTADRLYNNIQGFFPDKPVMMLENACDYEHFCRVQDGFSLTVPPELGAVLAKNKPVIGYVGALAHWVDWSIIHRICMEGYQVVMVGPMFGGTPIPHPNLTIVGERHYRTLPAYIKSMDVLIIPFLLNDITKATNPIKMWEYLASGKPIVMTNIPEAVKAKGNVDIREPGDDFMEGLYDALGNDDISLKRNRMDVARENSWRARYEKVYQEIVSRLG